jgi:hypothetical protein
MVILHIYGSDDGFETIKLGPTQSHFLNPHIMHISSLFLLGFLQDIMNSYGLIWGQSGESKGWNEAVKIFSLLPFEWLKGVVESVHFNVVSDMDR